MIGRLRRTWPRDNRATISAAIVARITTALLMLKPPSKNGAVKHMWNLARFCAQAAACAYPIYMIQLASLVCLFLRNIPLLAKFPPPGLNPLGLAMACRHSSWSA